MPIVHTRCGFVVAFERDMNHEILHQLVKFGSFNSIKYFCGNYLIAVLGLQQFECMLKRN